jgi:hypothetical protein
MILPYLDDIYVKINYTEDMLQSVNFITLSDKIGILDKSLYNYRINNSSLVHNMSKERIIDSVGVEDKIRVIIERNCSISKKEMLPFYSNAVNNIMDSLYRLNNQKGISRIEHVKLMQEVINDEIVSRYIKEADYSRVTVYNRIRLGMVRRGLLTLLVIVDKIILIIQNITDILKNEKKYE